MIENINQICFAQVLLIITNGISLAIFGIDKLKSKTGGWRVSESKLLLFAFFGPFGAILGMLLFRHKTHKLKFLLVSVFLVIQTYLILFFSGYFPQVALFE
jgi:uncharacterized membrane protein YsdA (DUF1294 family)